jgi:hypothetical protein
MVGNVRELIRGSGDSPGQVSRFSKGAGFNSYGFELGAAPYQWLYGDQDRDTALGFRCVLEVANNPAEN